MKLCRNCRTINADSATACAKCKMPDQLIDYNPDKTREWKESMMDQNKVSTTQKICGNCGTTEYGSGSRCARCNFPISIKQLGTDNPFGIRIKTHPKS